MEESRIDLKCKGIKCDNSACDYEDLTVEVEQYEEWLNKPCPKCGENLLTEEDHQRTLDMISTVKFLNALPEDMFNSMMETMASFNKESNEEILERYGLDPNTEKVSMTLDLHDGVKIKDIRPSQE